MTTTQAATRHLHTYYHKDTAYRKLVANMSVLARVACLAKAAAPFALLPAKREWIPSPRFTNLCRRLLHASAPTKAKPIDMSKFPPERIRNFSITAHIDHGKSTLADRLLENGGVIKPGSNKQFLDKLKVERERGITVKAQTVSLFHEHEGETYLINLIDTPGHVDFSYEVSRSLAACQGTLLLVDASQGVQAQTVANFYLAFGNDLTIIPVLNKIDLPHAEPDRVIEQLASLFDFEREKILKTSAKSGLGVETVLPAVIQDIPSPLGKREGPLKAFLFDSWYDEYKGVICLIEIVDGVLKKGDEFKSHHHGKTYEVLDIGIMHPEPVSTNALYAGQVGYVITGMRSTKEARVGDTFYSPAVPVEPMPGFKEAKPMVYAGIFPMEADEFEAMALALEKLTLNDASVTIAKTRSNALGFGWRLGFLGLLHMEVFSQRLEEDYGANLIATAPTVPYKAKLTDGSMLSIEGPEQFPEKWKVECFYEPTVIGTLIFPAEYLGKMLALCESKRGVQKEMTFFGEQRVMLRYILPLAEIATSFYDQLKSISSGYASFDYEEHDYQEAQINKMDILLNGQPVDALSTIVHASNAQRVGRALCEKLKETIKRQLFDVAIQATYENKVVSRENVKAVRKNVTAKCYGGDVSRKMKLLNKQREGKKRMKMVGNVEVPKEAFLSIIKTD